MVSTGGLIGWCMSPVVGIDIAFGSASVPGFGPEPGAGTGHVLEEVGAFVVGGLGVVGGVESKKVDEILPNISVYWLSNVARVSPGSGLAPDSSALFPVNMGTSAWSFQLSASP